jgi:oligosaccharide reducing-end xylanase
MNIRFRSAFCLSRLPFRGFKVATLALLSTIAMLMGTRASAISPGTPATDGDGTGAYASGRYRNVFVELGHPESEVSAKIESAYQQLFHGDPLTQAVYFQVGKNANGPLAYLTDWANHDARTEGMSYGMMTSVELNHKPEFDALWNWTKTYMYISDPHHPSYGYFSWSCKTTGRRTRRPLRPMAKSIL